MEHCCFWKFSNLGIWLVQKKHGVTLPTLRWQWQPLPALGNLSMMYKSSPCVLWMMMPNNWQIAAKKGTLYIHKPFLYHWNPWDGFVPWSSYQWLLHPNTMIDSQSQSCKEQLVGPSHLPYWCPARDHITEAPLDSQFGACTGDHWGPLHSPSSLILLLVNGDWIGNCSDCPVLVFLVFLDWPESSRANISMNNQIPCGLTSSNIINYNVPTCLNHLEPVKTWQKPHLIGYVFLKARKSMVSWCFLSGYSPMFIHISQENPWFPSFQ